jgi:hypothetical protein
MHVDNDFLKSIDHFDCPHILWTKIWEIYGDYHTPPFLDDHDLKFNSSNQVPHYDIVVQEVVCLVFLESSE